MLILKKLRQLLFKALEMIDNGECDDITEEQLEEISVIMNRPKTVGREEAAKFLEMSLNRFHELRDTKRIDNKNEYVIKCPRTRKGFKEKEYYISDLRNSLEYIKLYDIKIH